MRKLQAGEGSSFAKASSAAKASHFAQRGKSEDRPFFFAQARDDRSLTLPRTRDETF